MDYKLGPMSEFMNGAYLQQRLVLSSRCLLSKLVFAHGSPTLNSLIIKRNT